MAAKVDVIRDLTPSKEQWRIKVRVIRLWRQPNFHRPEMGENVEMVLIDDHGGKIQATVRGSLRIRDQLAEGGMYVIRNFGVGLNNDKFKPTQHEYRLTFNLRTVVTPIVDAILPINGFSFMEFEDIESYPNDTACLVDVIGFLCGIGDSKEHMVSGKRTKMIAIELDNLRGGRLNCSLWESYAEELIKYNSENSNKQTIIIVQFARMKKFMGKMGLSNTKFATRLLFNEDCAEVEAFRSRFPDAQSDSAQKLMQHSTQSINSQSAGFWKESAAKFICDIKDCKEAMTCVTYGTIKGIESAFNWWYKGCKKCTHSVFEDFGKWYCRNCDIHLPTYHPKFRLQVRVVDGTDSASFVLFDKDTTNLLCLSAAELCEQHFQRGGDLDKYPQEIDALIENSYLFKINVKKTNIDSYEESAYQVSRVCSDEDIIQSFLNGQMDGHGSVHDEQLGVLENTVSQVGENSSTVQKTLQFNEEHEDNDYLDVTPTSKLSDTYHTKKVDDANMVLDLVAVTPPTKQLDLRKTKAVEDANLGTNLLPENPANIFADTESEKPVGVADLVPCLRPTKAIKIEKD
ncbi:replication protein A 70 kDa DNA-binding subunit B-like [Gastrolobium bilobum]|uniref:replication protein A 70 kDa DNA-binding subunit B-like n=1 Tax=Gastrolobium bilobum TaxID=150636 RepID=UPI002AB28D7D|nr:replication protein A 70 kDa DNA-binding subunit B-like [Gastrolobium bilobum]